MSGRWIATAMEHDEQGHTDNVCSFEHGVDAFDAGVERRGNNIPEMVREQT